MLPKAGHGVCLWQKLGHNILILQQHTARAGAGDQAAQLGTDAPGGNVRQPARMPVDGRGGFRRNGKAKGGGKAQRAQHAQRVLFQAGRGISHTPYDAVLQILAAVEQIHQPALRRIGHGVDGKIPPGKVCGQAFGKAHAVRVAAVAVGCLYAERCHLIGLPALQHGYRPVLQAGCPHALARKQGHHLLRQGAGADVPIVRRGPAQRIAHAAAHHIGLVPAALQAAQNA